MIRPGDVYGPGSVPWVLRPLELAKSGQLVVPGEGDGVMLPIYVDDLVEAVALGLTEGKPGRPYTAWDGDPVSFEDYFNRIADMVDGRRTRRVPRPLLTAVAGAMEAIANLRGAASRLHPQRDHVHRPARHGLDPAYPGRARLGAARRPRRRHAPHRGVAAGGGRCSERAVVHRLRAAGASPPERLVV